MSEDRRYRDEEFLREQYVEKEKTTYDIAELCDCGRKTVTRWLKKHDIEIRGPQNPDTDPRLENKDWLREQYVENKQSLIDLAEECSCATATVLRRLNKYDIQTRAENDPERDAANKQLTNGDWLRREYVAEKQSAVEIAEKLNCSTSAVYNWLGNHNIEIRTISDAVAVPRDERLNDVEWLREQYVEQKRYAHEIAEDCGCSGATVRRWLKKHGIDVRARGGGSEKTLERRVPDERLTDAEWLREKYAKELLTCSEIGKLCGCSGSTIQEWLKRHGIEIQPGVRHAADARLTDAEWLQEQYVEKERTGYEIADECGCSFSNVYSWLRRHGIESQYNGDMSGENHPRWRGGQFPYGPGWNESKRQAVRERDDYTCQDPRCSVTQAEHVEENGEKLHVHHLRKAREIEDAERRNAPENLITLCGDCHKRWEKMADAGLVPEVVAE